MIRESYKQRQKEKMGDINPGGPEPDGVGNAEEIKSQSGQPDKPANAKQQFMLLLKLQIQIAESHNCVNQNRHLNEQKMSPASGKKSCLSCNLYTKKRNENINDPDAP